MDKAFHVTKSSLPGFTMRIASEKKKKGRLFQRKGYLYFSLIFYFEMNVVCEER